MDSFGVMVGIRVYVKPFCSAAEPLTGDTRKIFVSKTVDESHSARVLIGCKPITEP